MQVFQQLLVVAVTVSILAESSSISYEISEDDVAPHGYQRSYREGLDEERRSFSGDQEPIGTETQNFYKRSNGLKYIGLGKRGQDQEPTGFDTQNFYKRSNGLKYIGLGKRGQNGQRKKNSGMKYIGLGKRD